ncbi:hypothetical protein EMPS_11124 [Entomortierella parvispora]|uniref:BZIP domain-containing protein n=1 Tax=Entomortierella parvispora TaxID=205924 RepID=A0A9P3HL46_9FUNG|nr:hypothetical protein EMPS_11124 [Entomortierella parvispora]
MSLALPSTNVSFQTHARMHHHPQQHHSYGLEPESNSPTLAHEPKSNAAQASPIEPLHPSLFISTSNGGHNASSTSPHHHHYSEHGQTAYHQAPYQAPSPPYSQRSNSTDLSQKHTLPFPTKTAAGPANSTTSRHHPYAPSPPRAAHRGLSYSPPATLPPLTLPPLSPQSPIDSSNHYPAMPASYHHNSHHDPRAHPHHHHQQHQEQRRASSSADDRAHSYRHESPQSTGSPSPSPSNSMQHYPHPQQQQNDHGHDPMGGPPLSANDRRERNKAASAKYRAKKHYQSGEMKEQIAHLLDKNNVLTRQLDETRTENTQLKNLVEKLKGRLVAEKVLKRLREVGRERRGNGSASKKAAIDSDSDDLVGDDYDVDVDDDEDGIGNLVGDDDEDDRDFHMASASDLKKSKQQQRGVERKPKSRRRAAPRSDEEENASQ